ncbi:hypothetical protein N7507_006259 [Penicillium longicatenatum]|nr:hypothetical protein N7507_006259 [Penicillium longicatenatum]
MKQLSNSSLPDHTNSGDSESVFGSNMCLSVQDIRHTRNHPFWYKRLNLMIRLFGWDMASGAREWGLGSRAGLLIPLAYMVSKG